MSDSTNEAAAGAAPVDEGPNGHGSLGRLIPWPDESTYPNIPADEALELFLGWVESRGIELWPHQEEALLDLAAGDNLILGTPTGSGKSMVALGLCLHERLPRTAAPTTPPPSRPWSARSSLTSSSSLARRTSA